MEISNPNPCASSNHSNWAYFVAPGSQGWLTGWETWWHSWEWKKHQKLAYLRGELVCFRKVEFILKHYYRKVDVSVYGRKWQMPVYYQISKNEDNFIWFCFFCQTFCIPIVIPADREDKALVWLCRDLVQSKGRQLTGESQVTVPGSCVSVFLCFLWGKTYFILSLKHDGSIIS